MAQSNLPEVLQNNVDTNKEVAKNQEQLAIAMRTFTASNKTFAKTSIALNDFAKQQVKKLNPFKSLKEKFDQSFVGQKLSQKKEEENLAKKVGLTREELLLVKKEKELKDSQEAAAESLKASLEEYGLNTNTFFNDAGELQARMADRDERGRFQSAKSIVDGIVGSMESGQTQEIENRREQGRRDARQTSLMESLVGGIKDLGDNLLKGLKDLGKKGGMGLGGLAALIAAPIITLAAFFGQLKAEFRVLDNLTKGKLFAPFKRFGNWVKGLGGQFKAFAFEKFGRVLNPISDSVSRGIQRLKEIGTSIKAVFGQGGKFASIGKAISDGFKPVAKFAGSAGRLLGKLFLPVTVIMSVIDAVKGFMEGFSEEGILGGITGAFEGVITGLVAIPLDLLKDLVSWIAGKLGFEGLSETLDSFSFAEMFAKFFDFIQNIRLAISDWIEDKLLSLRGLIPSFLGGLSDEELAGKRANLEAERAARDGVIEANRLKKSAKNTGSSVEDLKAKLEKEKAEELAAAEAARAKIEARRNRRGGGAGGNKGSEINSQSAQAAATSGNIVVTTVAPTNVNAPTSTNVSSQTNVTPTASRSRNRRSGRSYSPA